MTTPAGCGPVTRLVARAGAIPTAQRLEVDLASKGGAFAVCTAEDVPEDQLLVETDAAAAHHELVVAGLLPDARYTCEVRASCGGRAWEVDVESGRLDAFPSFTVSRDGEMWGAWTVLNSQLGGCFGGESGQVIAVDPDGVPRFVHAIGAGYVCDLDVARVDARTLHVGGGWGIFDRQQGNRGVFRDVDLGGEVVLDREEPDFGRGFNHHSDVLPDGSYLSLTGSLDTDGTWDWNGVGIEQWDREEGLVWTWSTQELFDAGILGIPTLTDPYPYHANSVEFFADAHGEAVWISLYGAEQLWRLDRATGLRTHVFGHRGGDFALVDPAGQPLPDEEFPWVQHGPAYEDDRVLLYDNGQDRPGGSYSRVAEYRLDLDARVATLLWTWTEPGWDDPILGDADRLPNGHVLVTKGFSQEWRPDSDDVSAVVELELPDRVVWRLEWPSPAYSTFRAERYDGCDLFANARYCPAIADRIALLRGSGD